MVDRTKATGLKAHPNAVATQLGWVDPDKGELLVSIRGLSGAKKWDPKTNTFDGDKPAKAKKAKKPIQVDVKNEEPVVEVKVDVKAEKPAKAKKETKPKAAKKTTKKAE